MDTAAVIVGSGFNDGVWHEVEVALTETQATISIENDKSTVTTTSDSGSQFSGWPYFGGLKNKVPQISYQLLSDGTFVGCIKVF